MRPQLWELRLKFIHAIIHQLYVVVEFRDRHECSAPKRRQISLSIIRRVDQTIDRDQTVRTSVGQVETGWGLKPIAAA